uniref:Cyclin-D-binding Myb-like transcription factor 1 n=1 Tax=Parasteatoda tepidariorum TaxID=114398 RepID=A0A2L2Y3E6_PARTP
MDSPEEDENSLQCDSPDECERTVVDAEVQLEPKDLETVFDNNSFTNLQMKMPIAVQNCVPTALQELVVITNTGAGFLNEHKLPINAAAFNHPSDGSEGLAKRICIEQDGQTFILALQDGLEGFSSIVEVPPKGFPTLDPSQLLSLQESSSLATREGINQSWFTSREEKTTLHNKGHLWKQGMWSKEEIELLESNIQLYCKEHDITNPATIVFEMSKDERKDFYRTVAKGLNRPLFSVYRRVIRMYDNKNHVGKYTSEELAKLKKLRSVYGNDWQAIGAAMGRSASSIKDRCRLMKDNCNQGKWLPAEERRLAEAVYDLTNALPGEMISSGLSWAVVAERVGTRSEKQCRTKWLNYLNWKVAGGTEWTRDDDVTLICRVYALSASDENQVDWNELSKDWMSVRSPQWLRGKWWSLKRHVPNSNTVSFQEVCEYLYQHFVLRIKVKEEEVPNTAVISTSLLPTNLAQAIFTRPKPAILQSPPPPIVVTASPAQGSSPVVTLTNAAPCTVDMTSAVPVLQALEVIPQNIITTNLLLTAPPLPLPPNQIIIQTMVPEGQEDSSPHVMINTQTSLASTQIPSAPPSPSTVLDEERSPLMEASFETQTLNENDNMNQDSDIENVNHIVGDDTHLISSDPMLAAGSGTGNSDMESEKMHSLEVHHLTHS